MKKLIMLLKKIKTWYKIVWNDKCDYKISFIIKIIYAIRGFSLSEYVYYNLKDNDYKDYISEYKRILSRNINGDYKIILDDKVLFEEIFRKSIKVPENYAWIKDGIIYGLHENNISNDNIIEYLMRIKIAVLKWTNGGGGKGVSVIEYKDNMFFINSKKCNETDVYNLFKYNGTAILCEYIEQGEFPKSLYPYSANTIRLVCAKKKNEKYAKIVKAVQRIGNEYSRPVDNLSSGGLVSEIDIETGKLDEAIQKIGPKENILKKFDKHPDTGMLIKDKVIPNWDNIKNQVLNLTNMYPYLNFVAWDVLITEKGICIIEGNASSGTDLFQLKKGVKKSELGDIYRDYGIIK